MTIKEISKDGVLGFRTQDSWLVGADEPTELSQSHNHRQKATIIEQFVASSLPMSSELSQKVWFHALSISAIKVSL